MKKELNEKEMKDEQEQLERFHEYWKREGEPHPSSNKYLRLNRNFFYAEGIQHGIETLEAMRKELEKAKTEPTRTEILEDNWYEFLVHAKTMNTIAQIENEKYFKEHPEQADLAPPYQTTWIQEQNFWQWYLDNKMPKVVVKKEKKSASK